MYICKRRAEKQGRTSPPNRRAQSSRRAVDRDDAPAVTHACTADVVYAGDRAILDSKGERRFRVEAERQRQCRPDRAAMRDGDDVAPGICLDQLMDSARHPLDDGEKALTAWNHLMCRRMPEARNSPARRWRSSS